MQKDDLVRLNHMLDAAKETIGFVQGKTRRSLNTNRMLVLALVKDIEIIGEAAVNLSKEFREALPQIPWPEIIGMRNRL
ncbi:MAG: HepT-like ribonuclease domain-containing protein, partial [Pseudomonadota bacterium]